MLRASEASAEVGARRMGQVVTRNLASSQQSINQCTSGFRPVTHGDGGLERLGANTSQRQCLRHQRSAFSDQRQQADGFGFRQQLHQQSTDPDGLGGQVVSRQ